MLLFKHRNIPFNSCYDKDYMNFVEAIDENNSEHE